MISFMLYRNHQLPYYGFTMKDLMEMDWPVFLELFNAHKDMLMQLRAKG